VFALAVLAFALTASVAAASQVNVVSQGEAPAKLPKNVHYFKTIQGAVEASHGGDWVLIAPGLYTEEVKVTHPHSGIHIRGMDRNTVILDGQHKPLPGGSNGIEVFKANNVWIENLTVRNFDRATAHGPGGNEVWWNGGSDTEKIGAHGWWGTYLTAYDTGLNGGYGIFTGNETSGEWNNIYASGFNDSGMYIGACPDCKAVVKKATMEPDHRKLGVQPQHRRHRTELGKPGRCPAAAERRLPAAATVPADPQIPAQIHIDRNRALHHHPQQRG
jgi:hypothetical protein